MRARVAAVRGRLRSREGSDNAAWTGAAVLVMALVIAGLLIAFGGTGGHSDKDGTSVTAGQSLPGAGPLDRQGAWDPYVAVVGGGHGASTGSQKQWSPLARRFATVFLRAAHDPKFLTRVKPLVSPQLWQRLRWVTRGRIPTGTVTGVSLNSAGDHMAEVTVSYMTNGTKHALRVSTVDLPKDGHGWMVYAYGDQSA